MQRAGASLEIKRPSRKKKRVIGSAIWRHCILRHCGPYHFGLAFIVSVDPALWLHFLPGAHSISQELKSSRHIQVIQFVSCRVTDARSPIPHRERSDRQRYSYSEIHPDVLRSDDTPGTVALHREKSAHAEKALFEVL